MIKAVIIDDEKIWLELLSNLLAKHCSQVKVVAKCNTAEDGIKAIRSHSPDVVFTDVEMPSMNGFDMLQHFSEKNFDVIFTTAFERYAVQAFKYSALDYLLKPIDPELLKVAMKKAEQKQLSKASSDQIDLFFSIIKSRMTPVKKIALPSSDGVIFVSPERIVRCESDSNYTLFVMDDHMKVLVAKTLKDAEDILKDFGFFRIHHSHLVNPDHIEKYIRGDGGYVLMKDGSHITVSRSYKEKFNELFSRI